MSRPYESVGAEGYYAEGDDGGAYYDEHGNPVAYEQDGSGAYYDDQAYYEQQPYEDDPHQQQQHAAAAGGGHYYGGAAGGYEDYPAEYAASGDQYDPAAQQYYYGAGASAGHAVPGGAAGGGRRMKAKQHGSSEEDSETFSDFTMRSDMAGMQQGMPPGGGQRGMPPGAGERYASYGPSTDSLSQMGTGMMSSAGGSTSMMYQGGHRGPGGRPYRPGSSQMSFGAGRSSGASTPVYGGMDYNQAAMISSRSAEPYPAWIPENEIPISKEEIEDIFIDLTNRFGFQRDSMRNMFDHLMTQLDSRASRMTPNHALLTLHADYIGGDAANYHKWYFAASMDIDDRLGFSKIKMNKRGGFGGRRSRKARKRAKNAPDDVAGTLEDLEDDDSLEAAEYRWNNRMNSLTQYERVRHIALYLLCWGEANQVRFMPECLCFIFKIALDYADSPEAEAQQQPADEGAYLRDVITPLYMYIRDQQFEIIDGKYVRRERDHVDTIGYDDVNQLFWYPEGLERIIFEDKSRFMDLPRGQRWPEMSRIVWKKVFYKTYRESRSWFHMITNFNRIWIIHFTMFWFYTAYNSPTVYVPGRYHQRRNNQPPGAYRFSAVGFGGGIACFVEMLATLAEWLYVPRRYPGSQALTRRFMFTILLLIVNIGPGVYVFAAEDAKSKPTLVVAVVHFLIAVFTFLFLSVVPLGNLFGSLIEKRSRRLIANQYFTYNFAPLVGRDLALSIGLWILVFTCKFVESYWWLTLSIRDPIRLLDTMIVPDCEQQWLGHNLCQVQPKFLLGIMYVTDLVLFFLDTYLWYIIWNTIFSVARSFWIGISIWTPWRNIYSRMPKRIYSKILATNDMEIKYKPKVLISQVWNAIVISMYREHLLAIDHVQKLLYHQVPSEQEGKRTLRAPTFFVSQDDHSFKTEFFPTHSEAERRIGFFAQSLSTPIPEPLPVDNMPTFTVLIPHYAEKILLSLREIIREEDQLSRVTLLEYLKQLHPIEWDCFVKDTKILAEETALYNGAATPFDKETSEKDNLKSKIDDLPFYCIGFKSAAPEYTLRTRIWASLRSQTLYRTVSGFMNYARAIKLLYRVENPEVVQLFGGNSDRLERELERMARRKFKFLVSMQRYVKFNKEEQENAEFLLRAYPDLQIAYLDEEPAEVEGEEPRLYSTLIDGHCELMENGQRRPKFRIQLSGNPILGDGKSDNQNMSVIYYRGEYLQLIDANQDNYLEECLKIRSVLAEFEELSVDPSEPNPYAPGFDHQPVHPVAILGAREYIFSENSGVLGDVAAAKEQTFGTLFARTLAQIGGKLHYGHPDFLNGIFMTTRGGVSKAQKGLHLNEDIYAGMMAFMRGGRIKHCEYYQCGKGRDLGFGSILNFTTKVGTGMGEQLLSREYYYLGTRLRLDRLLSFYYAHAGFHVNNMFIMLSVQLLMIVCLNLGAIYSIVQVCHYDHNVPITDKWYPKNCFMLQPALNWVSRCILSIFIVFFIAFVPLVVQELTERGAWRAATRLGKHFGSLSPMFEVFACQIYAHSLLANLSFGGARYIGTGRGFATARIPFSILYSRFAGPSIYLGARTLMMLLFATLTVWIAGLIYFWVSCIALVISPFLYNPHQFAWTDFFVDYREFIRWLSRGNSRSHANSWIGFCRLSRTRITGYKRKVLGQPSDKMGDIPRAHFTTLFFGEIVGPVALLGLTLVPFSFMNSQPGVAEDARKGDPTNGIAKAVILGVAPILINAGVALVFFGMACCMGPVLSICCKKFGAVLAAIAHAISVIVLMAIFEVMWFLEGWSFPKALLGMIAVVMIQRLIFKFLTVTFLTREFKHDGANLAWWTGKWYSRGLGAHALSQPGREFVCKVTELGGFSADFILGHILLFLMLPALCVPYIDRWHSMILFWLRPSRQIRPPIFSLKQNKLRKRIVRRYATLYFLLLIVFLALIIAPAVAVKNYVNADTISESLSFGNGILNLNIQPANQNTSNTSSRNTTW